MAVDLRSLRTLWEGLKIIEYLGTCVYCHRSECFNQLCMLSSRIWIFGIQMLNPIFLLPYMFYWTSIKRNKIYQHFFQCTTFSGVLNECDLPTNVTNFSSATPGCQTCSVHNLYDGWADRLIESLSVRYPKSRNKCRSAFSMGVGS